MSSQWTSKYAIMRDLSLAQGCDVPAAIDDTVGVDDKPPAPNIMEETEEEYFGHHPGDGDIPVAPDLSLIQQMLEMVRGSEILSNDEDEPDKILEISKPVLIPNGECERTKNLGVPKTKVKKKRENVALNSILGAIASNIPITNMEKPSEPLKLLKPTDFMSTDKEIVDSVEKVKGWLDSQVAQVNECNDTDSNQVLIVENNNSMVEDVDDKNKGKTNDSKSYTRLLNWEPRNMFKRKSVSPQVKTSPPQKVSATPTASYRPSNLADEYYQKYLERSKLMALAQEDMWARAERIMKDIDEKKKSQAEKTADEEVKNEELEVTSGVQEVPAANGVAEVVIGPACIQLGVHRHALAAACAVCAARARAP